MNLQEIIQRQTDLQTEIQQLSVSDKIALAQLKGLLFLIERERLLTSAKAIEENRLQNLPDPVEEAAMQAVLNQEEQDRLTAMRLKSEAEKVNRDTETQFMKERATRGL